MEFKKIIRYTSIAFLSLFSAAMILLLSLDFFISEKYLAKLVSKFSDNWLKAEFTVEKVNLATFSHFPYLGIELEKAAVVSRTDISPAKADTLASFERFTLLISPLKIFAGQVDIKKIKADSPHIYAYVSEDGTPNWDIVKPTDMSAPAEEEEEELSINVNIREISVNDRGYFIYDSRKDALRASLFMNSLELQGRFTNDLEKIRIRKGTFSKLNAAIIQSNVNKYLTGLISESSSIPDSLRTRNMSILENANRASMRFSIDTLNISSKERRKYSLQAKTRTNIKIARNTIADNLPLDITGNISFAGRGKKSITLEDINVMLVKIPLGLNGTITYDNGELLAHNLSARIDEFPLSEFLEYVPKAIVPDIKKLQTDTRLSVNANIFGKFNPASGALPSADIYINVPKSYIGIDGRKERINRMELAATYHYRQDNPDSNMVSVSKMAIEGNGINANGCGYINNLSGDPYMDMKFGGYLHLDSAIKILPDNSDIYGSGSIDASLDIKSSLSNLTPYKLGNTNIKGKISAQNINAGMPSKEIFCTIYGGDIKAGSGSNGSKMISVDINVDSTYIKYANSLLVKGRNIRFKGYNEASKFDKNTKSVKPFAGTLSATSFEIRGTDSMSVRVSGTKNKFSILPYNGDYSIPSVHVSSENRRMSLRQDVNFVSVTNGSFDLQANLNNTETKLRELRLARLTDSLQTVYPQIPADSLLGHWMQQRRGNRPGGNNIPDDFTQDDYNFQITDNGVLYILNRWKATGKLNADRIRIATPVFPLRTRIDKPEITFDLNEMKITGGSVHSGQSSFAVNGEVSGIRRALARGGKLRANFNIDADTLNFNEIANAISIGDEYMAKGKTSIFFCQT